MIKFLKKFALCSKSLLRTVSFDFPSKPNAKFLKAVLASRIISTIKKISLNEYRSKRFLSLKETILKEINNY